MQMRSDQISMTCTISTSRLPAKMQKVIEDSKLEELIETDRRRDKRSQAIVPLQGPPPSSSVASLPAPRFYSCQVPGTWWLLSVCLKAIYPSLNLPADRMWVNRLSQTPSINMSSRCNCKVPPTLSCLHHPLNHSCCMMPWAMAQMENSF